MRALMLNYKCTLPGLIHIRTLKLTVEQKCDIATRELDEVREELQRKKAGMEKAYDNYRVCDHVYVSSPPTTHPKLIQLSTYYKSGNFHCKNIFVVDGSYNN